MKYLKRTMCDGIYQFIPLDAAKFEFYEHDEHEYRVELHIGGTYFSLFENKYIFDVDEYMQRIVEIPDGRIITMEDLL